MTKFRRFDDYEDLEEYRKQKNKGTGRKRSSVDPNGGNDDRRGQRPMSVINRELEKPPRCPVCGKPMVLRGKPHGIEQTHTYVCEEHGYRATAKVREGKLRLTSTPADDDLMKKRYIIHRYLDLAVDNGILGRKGLYYHLTLKVHGVFTLMHIGEMSVEMFLPYLTELRTLLTANGVSYEELDEELREEGFADIMDAADAAAVAKA